MRDKLTLTVTPPIEQLPDERWRPVSGAERLFSISDQARIYSWYRERLLTPRMHMKKGLQVRLRGKDYRVSHLVLEAFRGPKPPSTYAAHADQDRSNCALGNLSWRPVSQLQREISARKPRTHCAAGHVLTSDNVIRKKNGRTRCLTCHPLAEVVEWPDSRADKR